MECTINIELNGVVTAFSFLENTFICSYVNGIVDFINPEEDNGEQMCLIVCQSNTRYIYQAVRLSSKASANLVHAITIAHAPFKILHAEQRGCQV